MQDENLTFSSYNRDVSEDVAPGCNFGHRVKDADKFRQESLRFNKLGYYTKHPYNTFADSPYRKYWAEQKRRCLEGYFVEDTYRLSPEGKKIYKGGAFGDYEERFNDGEVKGDWITGYHYFYLNFSRIMITKYPDNAKTRKRIKEGKQVKGERIESFPDFWDYDYYYFHYLEEAERLGKHGSVLKSRGKGYSFKGASMVERNYHLIPNSKSFVLASEEAYLIKDGLLNKAQEIRNFVNEHTGFFKHSQKHNRLMHTRASHYKGKLEIGYKSEIVGKTLNNKPDRARGIRGKLILFEEAGEFPGLLKAWQIAKESVEQDSVTYGMMVAFGTGGSKMVSYRTLNEFFFNPTGYNIHSIDNIWSKKRRDTQKTGFFAPAYSNINGFMDKDGNTDVTKAYMMEFEKLEAMEAAGTDPAAVMQRKSERPLVPEDALLRADSNDFPTRKIDDRIADLATKRSEFGFSRIGRMKVKDENIVFVDDLSSPLVKYFPHDKRNNNEGAIEIWDVPVMNHDEVPDDVYLVGVDPYDQNSSQTSSLGSCFVINRVTGILAAEYTGRPKTAEEFYEQVLFLSMYYNAKVNFENNLLGLKWYFEKKGKLGLLLPAPEIIRKMSKVSNDREYGTPGTSKINQYARTLIKSWLLSEVFDGEALQQVNIINSVPLLQELTAWDAEGNYDRVSALGMLIVVYEASKGIVGIEGYKQKNTYNPALDPVWDELGKTQKETFDINNLIMG